VRAIRALVQGKGAGTGIGTRGANRLLEKLGYVELETHGTTILYYTGTAAVEHNRTGCRTIIDEIHQRPLGTGFPADFAVPWLQISMALVAALVLAPLVGLLPARWAARMEIVEALRYE